MSFLILIVSSLILVQCIGPLIPKHDDADGQDRVRTNAVTSTTDLLVKRFTGSG